MPDNSGLVKRYSNLVNLEAHRGHARPPTLVTADSPVRSLLPKSKTHADDGLNAVRGVLIGLAIGLSMWAALFGAWLLA